MQFAVYFRIWLPCVVVVLSFFFYSFFLIFCMFFFLVVLGVSTGSFVGGWQDREFVELDNPFNGQPQQQQQAGDSRSVSGSRTVSPTAMASALTSPNLRGGKGTTKSTRVESHLPKCPCCSWCLPLARSSDPAEVFSHNYSLAITNLKTHDDTKIHPPNDWHLSSYLFHFWSLLKQLLRKFQH